MNNKVQPKCAECSIKIRKCESGRKGKSPAFCPTVNYNAVIEKALKEYEKPEIKKFARMASIQEGECYIHKEVKPFTLHPSKPRVQEVCEFARKMNYKKLGLAFCGGLKAEARILSEILNAQEFNVVSVMCKCGGIEKEKLDLSEEHKIRMNEFEPMCNPIVQAGILNEEETDFNILAGLCVGHDSLFFKYSKAFTTVLIAKDRVLGHNPAAALYTSGSYYARLLKPGLK